MSPRLVLALVTAGALATGALGLYWKGRHEGAAIERPKTAAAEARAAVAGLETRGARETVVRAARASARREAAQATVTTLSPAALTSEDAHAPLDPARATRLRDADRRLCQLAPDLAGCAAD